MINIKMKNSKSKLNKRINETIKYINQAKPIHKNLIILKLLYNCYKKIKLN